MNDELGKLNDFNSLKDLVRLNESLDGSIIDKIVSSELIVVGQNEQSLELAERYNVSAVIDDGSICKSWNGINIVSSDEVSKNSLVLNCSSSISPVQVDSMLRQKGFENVLRLDDLLDEKESILSVPYFIREQQREFHENAEELEKIYHSFADEASRTTFLEIVAYRLTGSSNYMKEHSVRLDDQYWEDFLGLTEETFIDVGGYDGDTALQFAQRYPEYKEIIVVEPSKANMKAAKTNTGFLDRISYLNYAASNAEGIVRFNGDCGSSSRASEDGSDGELVKCEKLDNLLSDKRVTFIKMDIEGYEGVALEGCKRLISEFKPRLAIAAYHKADDIRKLHGLITKFNPDYKSYLRHYTSGWSESVLFFV